MYICSISYIWYYINGIKWDVFQLFYMFDIVWYKHQKLILWWQFTDWNYISLDIASHVLQMILYYIIPWYFVRFLWHSSRYSASEYQLLSILNQISELKASMYLLYYVSFAPTFNDILPTILDFTRNRNLYLRLPFENIGINIFS